MTSAYVEAVREFAADLADDLATDIRECEAYLQKSLSSDVRAVDEIAKHVAEAGGKRLRPILVSLSARAVGKAFDRERVAAVGACMEMVHMATLIHDDVVDEARLRRGRPTASAVFGNTASILSGDVLLAKAMEILAVDGDLRIIRLIAGAVVEMAEGEVLEVSTRGDFELSEERHLDILRRKTGALMAACCGAGALIADADPGTERALRDFGGMMGIGFQIADDIIDFESPAEISGKPQATDFREGCATLPLILLRACADGAQLERLRGKFGNGVTDEDLIDFCSWMEGAGSFEGARDRAREFSSGACAALNELPATPARAMLNRLAEMISRRCV
ncbi:MAG TPA: polyprenyl synthetase family protein [Fimbriimonadales bacterium]|jgi:octaprenyl-diphosphate synthase|nr:polyprenyl synthetase family protein [Fimbriimonadales bacterium]